MRGHPPCSNKIPFPLCTVERLGCGGAPSVHLPSAQRLLPLLDDVLHVEPAAHPQRLVGVLVPDPDGGRLGHLFIETAVLPLLRGLGGA
jgi:hypothetical protein